MHYRQPIDVTGTPKWKTNHTKPNELVQREVDMDDKWVKLVGTKRNLMKYVTWLVFSV